MKTNSLIILLCLLFLVNRSHAQDNSIVPPLKNSNIIPLQIGDTIPTKLWDTSLIEIIGEKNTLHNTFRDFKDKWIIIDFWSSWCGPCIRSFKGIDEIQKQFPNEIKVVIVTRDERKRLAEFMVESQYSKGVNLPFYSESSYLSALFPHIYISHIVIVDSKGYIRVITGSKEVVKERIAALISGKPVDFTVKNDFKQQ